ncbi:hypothetical protein O987_17110 [Comamonas testosteroni TK102]|uniref:Uncharacterized protein n=1 Tax=Comamonas testosteroni TK102 TaxID=1392005 RepID=A0A076PUT9_COMTE|nr:hypothetical protein O987_17110 [Comamonas testosteroni TK102]
MAPGGEAVASKRSTCALPQPAPDFGLASEMEFSAMG